jgi:phage terminase small subunit
VALTKKRRLFIEEFLVDFNATAAARRAGYKHPNKLGPRLVKVGIIADAIKERIDEKCMSANEVLIRLAEHARGNFDDFIEFKEGIGQPYLRLDRAKELGLLHLIKKLKYNKDGRLEIELYDAQSALALIGKHHKLFTERHELTGEDGGPVTIKVIYNDAANSNPEEAT